MKQGVLHREHGSRLRFVWSGLAGLSFAFVGLASAFPDWFMVPGGWYTWNDLVRGAKTMFIALIIGVGIAGFLPMVTGVFFGYWIPERSRLQAAKRVVWDVMELFPVIMIAIVVHFFFRGSGEQAYVRLVAIVALFLLPRFSRVIEKRAAEIREKEYIHMARLNGQGPLRVFWEHGRRKLTPLLVSNVASASATTVLLVTALGFLNLFSDRSSWGYLIFDHRPRALQHALDLNFLLPCVLTVLLVMSFHVLSLSLGEGRKGGHP